VEHPVGQAPHLGVTTLASVRTYGVWQGAYLTEALQEHSIKEATVVGAVSRVAAVGTKLVYLTQRADRGVSVFDLLSSIVYNATRS
jgi:hypothetical protein